MVEVIELKLGEEPSKFERYAMVLVSGRPSTQGSMLSAKHGKRMFYANDDPVDFESVLTKAKAWADGNLIKRVYVRRSHD